MSDGSLIPRRPMTERQRAIYNAVIDHPDETPEFIKELLKQQGHRVSLKNIKSHKELLRKVEREAAEKEERRIEGYKMMILGPEKYLDSKFFD